MGMINNKLQEFANEAVTPFSKIFNTNNCDTVFEPLQRVVPLNTLFKKCYWYNSFTFTKMFNEQSKSILYMNIIKLPPISSDTDVSLNEAYH